MQRRVYLDTVPRREALDRLLSALREAGWGRRPAEEVSLDGAEGRITAAPVAARRSVPHYNAAAVDGYACRAEDTKGASERDPLRLSLQESAFPVDTGDVLPAGCDAVIMVEDVHLPGDGSVEITSAAAPWQHVRPVGEDIVATEVIVPAGTVLGAMEMGALLAAGVSRVSVVRRPVVHFIPTGDEIVPPSSAPLAPGQIPEFNSATVGGMLAAWGADFHLLPVVPDEPARLRAALEGSLERADLVIVCAGSSAGSEDYTAAVLGDLGTVLVHGVAIRPGKPVVLALVDGKPVIGLPGYPVSAVLAADLLIRPLVEWARGALIPRRERARAQLARPIVSPPGAEEYVRVRLAVVGDRLRAAPLPRGAGALTSLVKADGWIQVPLGSEGLAAGAEVEVELLRSRTEVEGTLLNMGSHDVLLDLLDSLLRANHPGRRLASAHVGSLAGLMALARGEAHLCTSHLLDEESGEFNVPYVRKYLPGRRMCLVNLALRQQGFIVPPGNPQGVNSFADLARPDVRFINRQKGSGTRVLLDYHLSRAGLAPDDIRGYEREEYTHLAVGAAVQAGSATCGLGVLSAARALGLDFRPVVDERFDLVVPAETYELPAFQQLLAVIRSEEFRREGLALGGYEFEHTGEEMWLDA